MSPRVHRHRRADNLPEKATKSAVTVFSYMAFILGNSEVLDPAISESCFLNLNVR